MSKQRGEGEEKAYVTWKLGRGSQAGMASGGLQSPGSKTTLRTQTPRGPDRLSLCVFDSCAVPSPSWGPGDVRPLS